MITALRRTFRRDTSSVGRVCVGRGAETCARTRIALLLTREERFTGGKNDTGGAQRGFSRARLRGRPGGYGCLAFSRRRPSRRFAPAERPRGRRGPGAGCRVPGRYREAPVTSVVASLQQQTWRIRGGRIAGTINVSDLKGHRLRGRTRRMENPVGFLSLTGLARRPRGSRRNFEWPRSHSSVRVHLAKTRSTRPGAARARPEDTCYGSSAATAGSRGVSR